MCVCMYVCSVQKKEQESAVDVYFDVFDVLWVNKFKN